MTSVTEAGVKIIMKPLEKIDMHSHYFPDKYYSLLRKYGITHPDNVFVPEWTLEDHLSKMEKAGILYTALSITSPFFSFVDPSELASAVRGCNEEGSRIAEDHPDKIGILASLPLPDVQASLEEIDHCVGHLNIKGFALPTNASGIYMGNPALDPVMKKLDDIGALVTLHPTSPAQVIDSVNETLPIPLFEFYVDTARAILNMVYRKVFDRFPNIRFVMPHGGGCFTTMVERLSSGAGAALDIKGNMRKMYFDLAGSPLPLHLPTLLEIVGAERLVYGIDFPYPSLEAGIAHGNRLDTCDLLTDDQRKAIYIENAKKLLSI